MKGLAGKPLEPHYVSATFTGTLGDPTEHLVEISQVKFLRSEVREEGLDHTSPPPGSQKVLLQLKQRLSKG